MVLSRHARSAKAVSLPSFDGRLNACPALTLKGKLEVVIDIFTSLANDPLIISIHELEGLHAAARSVLARSMDRRKKLPVSVFASQALTPWVGMHKSRLGTLYRAPLPVLKHILKKARTSDKIRSKSGHTFHDRAERHQDGIGRNRPQELPGASCSNAS